MRLIELFETNDKYFSATNELDAELNPESSSYKEEEESKAKKKAKDNKGGTPVVTDDVDNEEEDWTSTPVVGDMQSAGYRGREEAKANAGMPHDKYQRFDPDYFVQDTPDVPTPL